MTTYYGKGVFDAIAIGKAFLFQHQDRPVRKYCVSNIPRELERLKAAKELAKKQLREFHEKALREVGEATAQIFEVHMMLLEDDTYNTSIQDLIETQSVNAEYAVSATAESLSITFSSMEDAYMQDRAADIKDISDRLILCLGNAEKETLKSTEKMIICADDLTPSDTISLNKDSVLAFVTAYGSPNSHTAILARAMNIPAVIDVGFEFLSAVTNGMQIIVDGHTGEVMLEPDDKAISKMLSRKQEVMRKKELLQELKGKETITIDGRKIKLCANVGTADDINTALENDAEGIGLFRSEFLYLENKDYPSEDMQLQAYRRVLESMAGKKVIIRTLDVGADKRIDYFQLGKEENPALGMRAIRICLTRPELFKTQLRALYRASVFGKLGIMFPMITSVWEVERILAICEEVKSELRKAALPFDENMELGIMIETPAAAIISDRLAPLVDFFSVGTNDLTQYTLAVDRQNAKLEPFRDTHHEAILRLVQLSAENAHKHGIWIGICGELAADPSLTETFLRMGIDELSVSPPFVLPLRDAVRKLDLSK
ncbi:MAG: phosphoenolpyruvate--protein phosphotransferase [Lachnospiraceae bacterium]|nr:phosphoenolpyruvate--protein phosphotransferase [Lachnospiraceae bacterium]